jgi:glutamine amidotransferase
MPGKIVIIDYGMGNLRSVQKKFGHIGIPALISSDQKTILEADKLILPGVGHFASGMQNLRSLGLLDSLNEFVQVKKKPILGICLGLQLFASHSEEGDCEGLGWIDATVTRFRVSDPLLYKIPHIGWNALEFKKESLLSNGIGHLSSFYFVHSFHLVCNEEKDILSMTVYDYPFASSVQKENIFGTQFHPEKSHDQGEIMLGNFANL